MSHILITGGTGMLSGAVKNFLSKYETVSVIARKESGFNKLSDDSKIPKNLKPLLLDYSDLKLLSENLNLSIQTNGTITTAVSWIHSYSKKSHDVIGNILDSQNIGCEYYHILGSAYYDPSKISSETEQFFFNLKNVNYKKIILGFKTENNISRWLTDAEISEGVTEAVRTGTYEFKIGETEPWEAKP